MAAKKKAAKRRALKPAAGLLATAARTVGTVAGKIATGLGIAETKATGRGRPKPMPKKKAPAKSAPTSPKKQGRRKPAARGK